MIAGLLTRCCELCPALSRPLLRQYLRRIGWVPSRARWLVADLTKRLTPVRSVRTVSLRPGLWLEIDLASAMGRDVYYRGSHEPEVAAFLERLLKPGMTVLDIGANVGEVTLLAARLVGDRGKVVAVEVSPQTAGRLRHNIALNRLVNVELVESAVCDRDGPITFYLGSGTDSGSSSLSRPHDYRGETLTVPGVRLDTLAARAGLGRIDCIKLDIEGAEFAALRGAAGILASPDPPVVLFEYHRDVAGRMGWTLDDLTGLFRRHGYTLEFLNHKDDDHTCSNVAAFPPDHPQLAAGAGRPAERPI